MNKPAILQSIEVYTLLHLHAPPYFANIILNSASAVLSCWALLQKQFTPRKETETFYCPNDQLTPKGMQYTQKIMEEQFRRHGHDKDITKHGISPHTVKYGKVQGQLYPYGVCGVQIT